MLEEVHLQISTGCNIMGYQSTPRTTALAWTVSSCSQIHSFGFGFHICISMCGLVLALKVHIGIFKDLRYSLVAGGHNSWLLSRLLQLSPSTWVNETKTYPPISAHRWTKYTGLCASLHGGSSGANAIWQSQPAHEIITGCQGIYCQVWKRKNISISYYGLSPVLQPAEN